MNAADTDTHPRRRNDPPRVESKIVWADTHTELVRSRQSKEQAAHPAKPKEMTETMRVRRQKLVVARSLPELGHSPDALKRFFAESQYLDRMVLRPLSHVALNWEASWN